jgi:hypothetical protein
MESFSWLERAALLGTAIAFFAVAIAMVFYELARAKAKRPIMKGGDGAQSYLAAYFAFFVLGVTCVMAAIFK